MKDNLPKMIKLMAEMMDKYDYLQALESTKNAASDFADDCTNRLDLCKHLQTRIVPISHLWNLARLELNLTFLHLTFLQDYEEEFEEQKSKVLQSVASRENINLED